MNSSKCVNHVQCEDSVPREKPKPQSDKRQLPEEKVRAWAEEHNVRCATDSGSAFHA